MLFSLPHPYPHYVPALPFIMIRYSTPDDHDVGRGRSRLSAIIKSIKASRKRRREEEEEDAERYRRMMEEEDEWLEEWQVFQRKRNTGARPGGTNTTGRAKYEDSVWGRMLRDPQLRVAGSPLQKIFTRRFPVSYSIFLKLVEWTKGWHETGGETDACN